MKLLGGRYETLKPIASGGMATVHLGRAIGVGGFERLVAIKVMHPHIATDPEFVAMFLDEARLAARIRHPNVVATIDVQESAEGLFLVMEFVDGPSFGSLRRVASKSGSTVPPNVNLRILLDALAGLHEAHELADDEGEPLQLVHRDATPANILVGTDGVARITDFGVARAEARLSSTRGGQLKGKIPYMPPEQLLGDAIDRRCDVYAAGVVLWEALVGRRLFNADSDGRLVQMIINGPEHSPRELDRTIPPGLDSVCMRALSGAPDQRYSSAAEFAEAIEELAETEGIAIATPRAVAAFVERSGAHTKLGPKEIAALKRGVASDGNSAVPAGMPSAPSSAASGVSAAVSSVASAPAVSAAAGAAAEPDRADQAVPAADGSSSSEVSSVTATEATLSAKTAIPMARPRRTTYAIGAAAVVAVVGIGVGLMVTSSEETATAGPPDELDTATEQPAEEASTAASAEPTAEPADSSTAVAADAAAPTAEPSTTVEPPPKPSPPATHRRPPPPRPPKRPPVNTSFNPDRL